MLGERLYIRRLVGVGLKVCTLLARLGLVLVIASTLTPEEAGRFGLYASGLLLAAGLIGLDSYTVATRDYLAASDPNARQEIILRHAGMMFLAFCVFAPLAWGLYFWSGHGTAMMVSLFMIHLLLEFSSQEMSRFLVAMGRPLSAEVVTFVRSAAWVGVPAMMMALGLPSSDSHLILSWFSASAIAALVGACFFRGQFMVVHFRVVFDWDWISRVIRTALVLFAASLCFRAVLGLDRYIVGALLNIEAVGVYTVLASLAVALITVGEAAVSVWRYPTLVRLIQAGERRAAINVLRKFRVENFIFNSVAALAAAIVLPQLIVWFARPEYSSSFTAFYWILGGVYVYCLSLPSHYVLYASRKDGLIFASHGFGLIVMTASAYFAVPKWGLTGAAAMLAFGLAAIGGLRFLSGVVVVRRFSVV